MKHKTYTHKPKTYTYNEVKNILCEACKLNAPETWIFNPDSITHYLNGVTIQCKAQEWRFKEAIKQGQMNNYEPKNRHKTKA